MSRKFQRVLVIEDDATLRAAIVRSLGAWGDAELLEAGTAAGACKLLAAPPFPDLIITDVRLPDESVFHVLDAVRETSPAPLIVAISGMASADEAFRLGQSGVRAYLPKPFSSEELAGAIERACNDAPSLEPLITASVGCIPMRQLQDQVRQVMVKEALARTKGSRSGAARLLQVTRQAVQQIVRSEKRAETPPSDGPSPKTPAA